MKTRIDTYLKRLELESNRDVLFEIFTFIRDDIQTDKAVGIEDSIAKLFIRTLTKLDQDSISDNEMQQRICQAFDNIGRIANPLQTSSEMMCIYVLNSVHASAGGVEIEEMVQTEFEMLLDNFEEIRIVFKICNASGERHFPIGKLLFQLIKSDNISEDLKKVQTIQAIMLALQIFDKTQIPHDIFDPDTLVKNNHLAFIEYLSGNYVRIGSSNNSWKTNYEKNGSLVLYDYDHQRVLIRNTHDCYFSIDEGIKQQYSLSDVHQEVAGDGSTIAYYVEYLLPNLKSVKIEKEFASENNAERVKQILENIYDRGCFNVFMDNSLVEINNRIVPINPYTVNDEFAIVNDVASKDGVASCSNWLKQYGLFKIAGNGLRYVNLGLIATLENIQRVNVQSFKLSEDDVSFNLALSGWIDGCMDKQKAFNLFLKEYSEQIDYIQTPQKLYEKMYNGEYLIPNRISIDILSKLDFDERLTNLPICFCKIENDFANDTRQITVIETGADISDYSIEEFNGEDLDIESCNVYACVDDTNKKVYVGNPVTTYNNYLLNINRINLRTISESIEKWINEAHVIGIAEKMNVFFEAFSTIHKCIPIESIARYRIIHHLMLFENADDEIIKNWMKLIDMHEVVDYSIVNGKSPILASEGVLYVAKDRGRAQSTLKHINESYFGNSIARSKVDLFDQKVTFENGYYCSGNAKIEKIKFIFDLIQNGKATIDALTYYLSSHEEDDKHMYFSCDGKSVSVAEIIFQNKCDIEIYSIYAGENGIKQIHEFLDKDYSSMNCVIDEPLVEISNVLTKDDVELIHKVYPRKYRGSIGEGRYLIVREFNQPKQNMMNNDLLDPNRVVSIFVLKPEVILNGR